MKKPFRFHRGELNGYYIQKLLLCHNEAVTDVNEELVYQADFQWKLEGEVGSNEMAIRESDIVGVGKFAGIYRPIQYSENIGNSVRLTESHLVNGQERSERGLFVPEADGFGFVRTEQDDYPTDITVESTPAAKSTLVPHGLTPLGYVPYGVNIFNPDGSIIPGAILSTPPVDGTPYTEYYGDNYLYLEEHFTDAQKIMSLDMFKKYIECLMRIRYNGVSTKEFLYITELLGEGYIHNITISQTAHYYVVNYSTDVFSSIDNKTGRLGTWLAVCAQKFKLFQLVQV